MAKTPTQYGTWVAGQVPIEVMLGIVLDSMASQDRVIPKNEFGCTKFEVSYRYMPPSSPDELQYMPDEAYAKGFTAIKLTYDVEVEEPDEREEESGSEVR